MNQELIRDLEIFKDLPEHIKNACEYAQTNPDKLNQIKNDYRNFKRKLNEEIYKFRRKYSNVLNIGIYNKIMSELSDIYWLSLTMTDIIEDTIDLNNPQELDKLGIVVQRLDQLNYLKNLDVNKILPSMQMKSYINNQTQRQNNSTTSSRTENFNRNKTNSSRSEELPLQEKINRIPHQSGDNYNVSVMQTIISHDISNIDKQLKALMNKPNLGFTDMQLMSKLQKDKDVLSQYIADYEVNSHFILDVREGRLNHVESKIDELENKRKIAAARENRSFVMRRIQKYNVDKLTQRINELKQKRGIMLRKQRTVTASKHDKFYKRASNINNITSFVETLGTEVRNIGIDIVSRFKSCKNNGTLSDRLTELKRKTGVLESSQPVYGKAETFAK